MMYRILALAALGVLSVTLTLSDSRLASAQGPNTGGANQGGSPGTVLWAVGYPKAGVGSFDVQGTYTTNPGWTVVGPASGVYYQPQSGGVLQGTPIDLLNGNWGALTAQGAIGPKTINVAAGGWTVTASIVFEDQQKNKVQVNSQVFNVNVK